MIAWSCGKVIVRFWSRVERRGEGECWPWKLKLNEKGYGRFTVNLKTTMAHVASYLIAHGSIPDGLCVLHRCDNPKCVNPAHLFLGTRADNNADMRAKGRAAPMPRGRNDGTFTSEKVRGRKHPCAKLTQAQLDDFVRQAAEGEFTANLAARFGLTIRHANTLRRQAGVSSGRKNQHA